MIKEIKFQLQESIATKNKTLEDKEFQKKISQAVRWVISAYKKDKKTLWCGNGGSSCDAMHATGELVARFKMERRGLPAITLGSEMATLTAIANDYDYNTVFKRGVEAWAQSGDVMICMSTSGNSGNVIEAVKLAKKMGVRTIGLLGKDGGKLKRIVDLALVVPSNDTPRIQEVHITILHILCDLVERKLFEKQKKI